METDIIIPEHIFLDAELSPTQKLLMGLIISLSTERGYCWASNQTLSEKLGSSPRSITGCLKILEAKGYVKIKYHENSKRFIKPDLQGGWQNLLGGSQNLLPIYSNTIHSNTIQDSTTYSNTVQGSTILGNTKEDNTKQSNTVQYYSSNTVQLEGVKKLFLSNGKTNQDAIEFFEHFEAVGWVYRGEPVRNWQALAKAWIRKLKPEPKMKAL